MERRTVVILHNVRSAHNVGSIFRTADAAGVSRIYLTGYTPAPLDRFRRPQKEIAKTALGAEKSVPWERRASLDSLVASLRESGFRIVALEQSPSSTDYRSAAFPESVAVVFGNEVRGVDARILKKCDAVFEIPMRGTKESLNVAVAAGIFLFQLRDGRR